MLNLTYWDSRKVDNMQLHGWKRLKTGTNTMVVAENTPRLIVI